MNKEFMEIKDLIHGLDKNISEQIGGLDKRFSLLEVYMNTISEKLSDLEKTTAGKADKAELEELKKEFAELKKEFFKVKEETSKNSTSREGISKIGWLLFTTVIGLLAYIIKIKMGL